MEVEQFYDREAHSYDDRRWTGPIGQYVRHTYDRLVSKSVPIDTAARYLEIGCGTGRFTVPLAESGIALTAIDTSPAMLSVTKARLAQMGATRVELRQVDARCTNFPDESFDVIFSFNAINHIPEYERVISEVGRLLKRGGTFVVGYPSFWSLYLPYAALVNLVRLSLHRRVYTRWPSTPALVRQARTLGLEEQGRLGMFHSPAFQGNWIAKPLAALLRLLGNYAETGFLRPLASIHVVTFRKQ